MKYLLLFPILFATAADAQTHPAGASTNAVRNHDSVVVERDTAKVFMSLDSAKTLDGNPIYHPHGKLAFTNPVYKVPEQIVVLVQTPASAKKP